MVQPRTAPRCPSCQNPIQIRVEQLIDADRDPAAKARLLSGSLNRVRCGVCGWEGQMATPIVYHDPAKELLLTFMPLELGLPKAEQERVIGQLINEATSRLPAEKRKAYLLQPQSVLTHQGLIERVLEADGVTREQLDEQRARIRLLEELLRVSDDEVPAFVTTHDAEMDEVFFQLASLSLQTARDPRAAQAAGQRIDQALELSSLGKRIAAQQEEIRAAAESLSQIREAVTREAVLELMKAAPNKDRVAALATLARPVLDYTFFQDLSGQIEAAQGEERARLADLRSQLLKITQEIDAAQEARIASAGALLQSLAQADNLDEAIQAALPAIDELFLNVLAANLEAAHQRNDSASLAVLQRIDTRLRQILRDSLPPGLRLAQDVIQDRDEAAALRRIDDQPDAVDAEFLSTILAMAQRAGEAGDKDAEARLERLHQHAVGVSMRRQMSGRAGSGSNPTTD